MLTYSAMALQKSMVLKKIIYKNEIENYIES